MMTDQELSASLFRRDLHQTMVLARGITLEELGDELGISRQAVSQYLVRGGLEERADRFDQAIDAISRRRGLTPARTVRPVSAPRADGLPDVVTVEGEYRMELVIRDLMKAPGFDV